MPLRAARLGGRDAAFATELTYGAIRLRGRYDPIIAVAAARGLDAIDPAVLDTLRLGVHQLLGMRVPPHAATAETVGLARAVNGIGAAGFVNAVLRRVGSGTSTAGSLSWPRRTRSPAPPSSTRTRVGGHRRAGGALGHQVATVDTVEGELEAALRADNDPATVSLVARPGLVEVAELLAAGAQAPRWAPTAVSRPAATLRRSRRCGRAGRRCRTRAHSSSRWPRPRCRSRQCPRDGPSGGSTSAPDLAVRPPLGALAVQRGADLVANEVSPHRAELVRKTLAAVTAAAGTAGSTVDVRVGDGREIGAAEPHGYDRVLVDAPCTGLGALRRRPEARWRRQPSDVPTLARLQRELLASALDAVRPGGWWPM